MSLDIQGGLKNIPISKNRYVVIDELLSNAIDSYLIRRNNESHAPDLLIEFKMIIEGDLVADEPNYNLILSCKDNGVGFGEEQIKAFLTMNTSFKDYLDISGVGKCKGAGRIQFFHYFESLKIDSYAKHGNQVKNIKLNTSSSNREVTAEDFAFSDDVLQTDINTKIELVNLSAAALQNVFDPKNIKNDFSAAAIKHHVFKAFLQRLIALQGVVSKFQIIFESILGDKTCKESITNDDLPRPIQTQNIEVMCTHGNTFAKEGHQLQVSSYEIDKTMLSDEKNHEVALCANHALVKSITKEFLRTAIERKQPVDGKYYLILVEGELLEKTVNIQRDGFLLPAECSSDELFEKNPSIRDVVESLESYVFNLISPGDFDKEELIDSTAKKFGISRKMISDANVKVHFNDTESTIAKRVLKKHQEKIVDETSKLFEFTQELLQLDPRDSGFREAVNEMSWHYTSTLKEADMANLSQLVIRRSSMLKVLKHALENSLSCQVTDTGQRKENEKIIHNIFFPTGKDDSDEIDHDVWILNEEYHYFEHISSDKALSSYRLDDGSKLFDEDIDEALERLFSSNNEKHGNKRPDIAIFNQEGSAIIIELKAPGVFIQEHVNDLIQYARLLASKSGGRLNKFYGYLIGDSIELTRVPASYTMFPSGKGFFNTEQITDHITRQQYGEIYSELLMYDDFIDRAEKRLLVYKRKLGLE